jgi:hypothetical protein
MDDGKAPILPELVRTTLCSKVHRRRRLVMGEFQGQFSTLWPPTDAVVCNDPMFCSDLLFTKNYGGEIAIPRTRLDRKMDWNDNAVNL